jgi:hypothetical protein
MIKIDYDWMVEMNSVADKAENDYNLIKDMTDEQLAYLVYWNWGYSGAQNADVTKAAINELAARGVDYNTLGELVNEQTEQYL